MTQWSKAQEFYQHFLDARDLRCPLPVLKLRKVLVGIKSGERLLMIADDPKTLHDVPLFISESNHSLCAAYTQQSPYEFYIEKA